VRSGRTLAGVLLGLVVRLWVRTLRVHVSVHPELHEAGERPWVLAFWHGSQFPLLACKRRRRTVVLVSLSSDGALQARALALQGLDVVRGSTSRGGVRGLAAIVRVMKRAGADAAFAVDGPRGPRGLVKGGAVVAARASGGVLVPMASSIRQGFVIRSAWDRFAIAWPFTRVDVSLGRPIDPRTTPDPRREVERALAMLDYGVST
jgi:lysophospholipid acyltransferase (LPLAT)-like uncharacterized protein